MEMSEKERLYFLIVLKFEQFLRLREKKALKWTQKDGNKIPINYMTDKHIENVINMLEHYDERETIQSGTLFSENGIANDAF